MFGVFRWHKGSSPGGAPEERKSDIRTLSHARDLLSSLRDWLKGWSTLGCVSVLELTMSVNMKAASLRCSVLARTFSLPPFSINSSAPPL